MLITRNALSRLSLFQFKPTAFKFSQKKKGMSQKVQELKKKEEHQQLSHSDQVSSLEHLSSAKFAYLQFVPVPLFLMSSLFHLPGYYTFGFLAGPVLVERYLSTAIFFNMETKNWMHIAGYLAVIGACNLVPGYASCASTLALAVLTLAAPFKFEVSPTTENDPKKRDRQQLMIVIKAVYFFTFMMVATLKALHYADVYEIEKKLESFNEENKSLSVL